MTKGNQLISDKQLVVLGIFLIIVITAGLKHMPEDGYIFSMKGENIFNNTSFNFNIKVPDYLVPEKTSDIIPFKDETRDEILEKELREKDLKELEISPPEPSDKNENIDVGINHDTGEVKFFTTFVEELTWTAPATCAHRISTRWPGAECASPNSTPTARSARLPARLYSRGAIRRWSGSRVSSGPTRGTTGVTSRAMRSSCPRS